MIAIWLYLYSQTVPGLCQLRVKAHSPEDAVSRWQELSSQALAKPAQWALSHVEVAE